jgi:Na+/melibiose symporter-like transporter
LSFLIGLFIAITGFVPGVSKSNPERIFAICWSFIFGGGLGMTLLTFVAGFAHDIQETKEG